MNRSSFLSLLIGVLGLGLTGVGFYFDWWDYFKKESLDVYVGPHSNVRLSSSSETAKIPNPLNEEEERKKFENWRLLVSSLRSEESALDIFLRPKDPVFKYSPWVYKSTFFRLLSADYTVILSNRSGRPVTITDVGFGSDGPFEWEYELKAPSGEHHVDPLVLAGREDLKFTLTLTAKLEGRQYYDYWTKKGGRQIFNTSMIIVTLEGTVLEERFALYVNLEDY